MAIGTFDIQTEPGSEDLRHFTKRVLTDLRALERMLQGGCFEHERRRIGAEQELFLVDRGWRPAPRALEVLEAVDDPHFTTELGLFNLEFNLDPLTWGGDCLSRLEENLQRHLVQVRTAAESCDVTALMTGILPTLQSSDLTLEQMTPMDRYRVLNEAMTRLRGGEYDFRIKGTDEIRITHDSVMLEACNTSFQVHFQVEPGEFAGLYNAAQAVAGPVLAAATNSPMLFGRRLRRETRIALFQQSIDTRPRTSHLRQQRPRVRFGGQWVEESVLEVFQEDVSRFRILLAAEVVEDPLAVLEAGGVPELRALRLFNGTVYRWNRPCYGISDGKPHLRIENRVLPAGPTPRDEVANAAFWFGLMSGLREEYGDIDRRLDFDVAKQNFVAAAQLGLAAELGWIDRSSVPARELICQELIPLARHGLEVSGVDDRDAELYLEVIAERVESGRTGAQWLLDSFAATRARGSLSEALTAITAATARRQEEGRPVHCWTTAFLDEAGSWRQHFLTVAQIMSTDLFTVNEDDVVDLVACMMDWRHIRHVPVEDHRHRLVGLVTHRAILRLVTEDKTAAHERPIPVSEIMQRRLITATPDTPTLEAVATLRRHRISCLPVVENERLVGIVTEHDLISLARPLLEAALRGDLPLSALPPVDDEEPAEPSGP